MKRDMELIRLMLLELETDEPSAEVEKQPMELRLYNLALMKDAGFIEAEIISDINLTMQAAKIVRMTWAGHDFLDSTRNPKVWGHVRDSVIKSGVSWSFDILKEVLKREAVKHIPGL